MNYLSQDNETQVEYIVHSGDWDIVKWTYAGEEYSNPSENGIDIRTVRTRSFRTLEEAQEHAQYIMQHADGEWLAYIEIKECVCKVIDKVK